MHKHLNDRVETKVEGETYFCSRSGDFRYCESSEGLRSLASPILVARRMPAGGRRSGLSPIGSFMNIK